MKKYNIELMKKLNDEYKDKPIILGYSNRDSNFKKKQAEERVHFLNSIFELKNKKVLEIGCGSGYVANALSEIYNCQVTAVDVEPDEMWKEYENEAVKFYKGDLTANNFLNGRKFDVVVSFFTWEHIQKPIEMLQVVNEFLEIGGFFYLSVMPYCSPLGSHLYRNIYFPYPQLVFDEKTVKEFSIQCGVEKKYFDKYFYLNKMVYDDYIEAFDKIGFCKLEIFRKFSAFDRDFIERYKEKFEKYKEFDLKLEYFSFALVKSSLRNNMRCSETLFDIGKHKNNIIVSCKIDVLCIDIDEYEVQWKVQIKGINCNINKIGKNCIDVIVNTKDTFVVTSVITNKNTGEKIINKCDYNINAFDKGIN